MRIIDADVLEETLAKIPARRIENTDGRTYALIRLSTVFGIIKQMPSAEPIKSRMETIYLDDAIEAITSRDETDGTYNVFSGRQVTDILKGLPSAQPEIIRCRDCKHKPHTSDKYDYDNGDCGFEIIFPDYRCPCRCEDEYYNCIPDDDWYCGNAERKEE